MTRDEHVIPGNKSVMNMNETLRYYFLSFWVDILQHFFEPVGWERRLTLSLSSCSNDDIEEGDPGSDSDFEIDTKKEVSSRKLHLLYINVILHSLSCCSCNKFLSKSICDFFIHAGRETEPQQRQHRQDHAQPLRAGQEGKLRGSVPPPPAQSPPQTTQRHVPRARRHHVPVSLPRCRCADCAAAGHAVGVPQETGMHLTY